jgi:hypothetical protein
MGLEAGCRVRFGDQASEGRALLETAELIFRGDFRLVIPFREIDALEAADGELRLRFRGAEAVFELGAKAAKWAARIRNPRSLIDKLDVKSGASVAVLGVKDASFLSELRSRTADIAEGRLVPEADFVF